MSFYSQFYDRLLSRVIYNSNLTKKNYTVHCCSRQNFVLLLYLFLAILQIVVIVPVLSVNVDLRVAIALEFVQNSIERK